VASPSTATIFPYDAAVPDPPAAVPDPPAAVPDPPAAGWATVAEGVPAAPAAPVRGTWRSLRGPDDVLALLDTGGAGVVAGVNDAGATFLAPILEELAGVVCTAGTPQSHVAIVSRDFGVPALMGAVFRGPVPHDGTPVELDCSSTPGVLRAVPPAG